VNTDNPAIAHDPRFARLSRIKPPTEPPPPGDLVRLPLERNAFVYQRLSTHEQKRKSLWSLEMQDALVEQARAEGYRDDQILVEKRDLGISGTKGKEHRPGLAYLIQQIEAGVVESVYVVHISRISRDQTLIDGLEFGELCRRHGVIIVMPTMRLNLRDTMHRRLYLQEIERAADEIELLKMRLGGPKRHKALSGRWDGRSVPIGYLLDDDPTSETHDHYVAYAPHAEVIRAVFQALMQVGTPTHAARWLRDQGVIVPAFPVDMVAHERRSSIVRSAKPPRCSGGFFIPPSLVESIVTNPVYLGWWLVDGRVVGTENHPPIVDEETFLLAQDVLIEHGRAPHRPGGLGSQAPQLLSGLLWCGRHDVPRRMAGAATGRGRSRGRYQCHDDYENAQTDHTCTLLDARVLLIPAQACKPSGRPGHRPPLPVSPLCLAGAGAARSIRARPGCGCRERPVRPGAAQPRWTGPAAGRWGTPLAG
jgi:DNA invertase Pin-like site-specific DNA recombinase